jgi:hypothetical protein
MATWKKIVVSGSNVSQLNNDAGYLTAASTGKAFSTASFNGTFLLADNTSGALNFASSSGQGLTISANAGTDTLTFGLAAIPNSSLLNSGSIIGSTVVNLGTTVTSLAGLSVVTSTAFTGSLFGTASWATNAITAASASTVAVTDTTTGTGPYYIMFADGTTGNRAVRVDSSTLTFNATTNTLTVTSSYANQALSASFASTAPYSGLTGIPAGIVSASVLTSPGQGQALLTTNGVAGSTVDLGLETSDSPQFAGVTAGNITVGVTNDNTINTTSGDLTIQPNVILNSNLTVIGTASFQNTANLLVADRFILLASGSNTTGDGGFLVQQGTQNVGELFGWDSGASRWAVTSSFSADASSFVPDAFMAAVTSLASTDPNTSGPAARYSVKGNIYVATGAEDIWIYS